MNESTHSGRLIRFARIPRAEKAIFAQAWCAMLAARIALVAVPVAFLIKNAALWGRRWQRNSSSRNPDLTVAVKRIHQAARFSPFSTCLSRSLAACFMMSRLGAECEVRIGVAKPDGRFRAHAWLEYQGQPLFGGPSADDVQYASLPSVRRILA